MEPTRKLVIQKINEFDSAKCTQEALEKISILRDKFKHLSTLMNSTKIVIDGVEKELVIGPREMALANTKLEEAAMWAIKATSHYNVQE